jgi:hypothetical protein
LQLKEIIDSIQREFMSTNRNTALAVVLGAVALAAPVQANIIINTFDFGQAPPTGGPGPDAPGLTTPANGLHALGVTFSFSEGGDPSSAALYGDSIGADADQLAPLTDPLLDGPGDGVLSLIFDSPTTFLSFDIAFSTDTGTGGTVTIAGNAFPITTTGNSGLFGLFSMGSFELNSSSSFTQAAISFDDAGSQFAIDNLSYDYSPANAPEPESMILIGSGLLVLATLMKQKRKGSRS